VSMSFDETMLAQSCKHGTQHYLGHVTPPEELFLQTTCITPKLDL